MPCKLEEPVMGWSVNEILLINSVLQKDSNASLLTDKISSYLRNLYLSLTSFIGDLRTSLVVTKPSLLVTQNDLKHLKLVLGSTCSYCVSSHFELHNFVISWQKKLKFVERYD